MPRRGFRILCLFALLVHINTDTYVENVQKPYTNIALNKPANTSGGWEFRRGNDGKPDTVWNSLSCIHEAELDGSLGRWWQVDLEGIYTVDRVEITSRSDCCPDRLSDFSIDLFTTNPVFTPSLPRHCNIYPGTVTQGGFTITVHCLTPVQGRYLRLTQHTSEIQFCELKVFGGQHYRFEPCSSFQQTPNAYYLAASYNTTGQEVRTRIDCAVQCGKKPDCKGFNIKYEPFVECELIYELITVPANASSVYDFYRLDPCWIACD